MADRDPNAPLAPQTPEEPQRVPTDAEVHLANLARMSTTAGVTNMDYVAVNHTAVAAILLGLASSLTFFGLILLPIAVIGLICGIVALRQINDSAGTQTGKTLAWGGILLSLALGGGAAGFDIKSRLDLRQDARDMAATIRQIGQHIRARQYPQAYALFDQDFQDRWPLPEFQRVLDGIQNPGALGSIDVFEWNGVAPYFPRYSSVRIGDMKVRIHFSGGKMAQQGLEDRYDAALRQVGDKWLVVNLPQFFPEKKKKGTFDL